MTSTSCNRAVDFDSLLCSKTKREGLHSFVPTNRSKLKVLTLAQRGIPRGDKMVMATEGVSAKRHLLEQWVYDRLTIHVLAIELLLHLLIPVDHFIVCRQGKVHNMMLCSSHRVRLSRRRTRVTSLTS